MQVSFSLVCLLASRPSWRSDAPPPPWRGWWPDRRGLPERYRCPLRTWGTSHCSLAVIIADAPAFVTLALRDCRARRTPALPASRTRCRQRGLVLNSRAKGRMAQMVPIHGPPQWVYSASMNKTRPQIAVSDDDQSVGVALRRLLGAANFDVETFQTGASSSNIIAGNRHEMVV